MTSCGQTSRAHKFLLNADPPACNNRCPDAESNQRPNDEHQRAASPDWHVLTLSASSPNVCLGMRSVPVGLLWEKSPGLAPQLGNAGLSLLQGPLFGVVFRYRFAYYPEETRLLFTSCSSL